MIRKIWSRLVLWHYNVCPKHMLERKRCRDTNYLPLCVKCIADGWAVERTKRLAAESKMKRAIETAKRILNGN